LDILSLEGSKAYLLELPRSEIPEIRGKVAGSRGAALTLCPHDGKSLPRVSLELLPRDFFS
jgi:hypothetical protein